jgi:hypothetical protein
MPLRETLSNTWDHVQWFLFPMLREETGPLTAHTDKAFKSLELVENAIIERIQSLGITSSEELEG